MRILAVALGATIATHRHLRWPSTWLSRTTFVQRIWRPDLRRATRPTILPGLRFHDLRHTHRIWLDEHNLPEALKSQRLGHQIPASAASTPTSPNACTYHYSPPCNSAGCHWQWPNLPIPALPVGANCSHKQKSADEEDPQIGTLNCGNSCAILGSNQ